MSISRSFIINIFKRCLHSKTFTPLEVEPGAYPFFKRQIPLDGTKTLDERLDEIRRAKIEFEHQSVNIGCKIPNIAPRSNTPDKITLERLARKRELKIDLNELDESTKQLKSEIIRRCRIANFFNVFDDLFCYPHFFYPITDMKISYDVDNDKSVFVYSGNILSPNSTSNEPSLSFDVGEDKSLYTVVLTSPDEHLEDNTKEYVHWMICNVTVKDGQIERYDTSVPYLQPIPFLGTGFHRYVFVLYKQDKGVIDLTDWALQPDCKLEDRTFSSKDFLHKLQSLLTPIGLSFFQSAWDDSVRICFRERLKCLEPIFEYNLPKETVPPQIDFPEGKEVQNYYDKYRDVKDINEEVLKERLKTVDPYSEPERLRFPLAIPKDHNEIPWVTERNRNMARRVRQWRNLDVID